MMKIKSLILGCLFLSLGLFADHSQFGLCTNNFPCGNSLKSKDLFNQLNINWIRAGIDWKDIENAQGQFVWNYMDEIVTYAQEHNLNILCGLCNAPLRYRKMGWILYATYINPRYINKWTRFVTAIVERYDGDGNADMPGLTKPVKYWEIWNEPNIVSGDWETKAKEFVGLILKPGIAAIRAADSQAKICGPGLFNDDNDKNWFDSITDSEVAFDVLTHHAYGQENTAQGRFDELSAFYIHALTKGYGGKEYWITETGWPTNSSENLQVAVQSMHEMFDYMLANSSWWKRTFWFAWKDTNDIYPLISYVGDEPNDLYYTFKSYTNPPFVTVISPNGGESWSRGSTHDIKWDYKGITDVKIELLKSGVPNTNIVSSTDASPGSYSWAIPSTQAIGTDYAVRITSPIPNDAPLYDTSDANFSISQGQGLPDVVINNIQLEPAAPASGQRVTVKATIQNQGTAATPDGVTVAAAFMVDGNPLGAFFVRTNGVDRPLAAGESYSAACETQWTASAGTHTFWVMADDTNRFPESDETNNVMQQSFTIGNQLADVVIDAIWLEPAAPVAGQKAKVMATVRNIGQAATPSGVTVAAAFMVDGNPLGAFFVRTNGLDRPLAAGESYSAACETQWTASVGEHMFWVMADDVNRFAESDENNNVTTITKTIQ